MNDTTIHLISGKEFDYANPHDAVIDVHDIAHALARTGRWGGHCYGSYSVASHTLLTMILCYEFYGEKGLALAALHHDDVEAFTGDWTSPMKRYLEQQGLSYRKALEAPIEMAICRQLGLVMDELHAGAVKDADELALQLERYVLKEGEFELPEGLSEEDAARYCQYIDVFADAPPGVIEGTWLQLHERLVADRDGGTPFNKIFDQENE